MHRPDSQWMRKARRVQDRLVALYVSHPDVSLIDIGFDPEVEGDFEGRPLAVRVHLRSSTSEIRRNLPEEMDGIPVRVVIADYQ